MIASKRVGTMNTPTLACYFGGVVGMVRTPQAAGFHRISYDLDYFDPRLGTCTTWKSRLSGKA